MNKAEKDPPEKITPWMTDDLRTSLTNKRETDEEFKNWKLRGSNWMSKELDCWSLMLGLIASRRYLASPPVRTTLRRPHRFRYVLLYSLNLVGCVIAIT